METKSPTLLTAFENQDTTDLNAPNTHPIFHTF